MNSISNKIIKTFIASQCIVLLVMFSFNSSYANEVKGNKRVNKIEKKADKQFIRGVQEDAFVGYQKAMSLCNNSTQKLELSHKLARLYTLCYQYNNAIKYYDYVLNSNSKVLSPSDVCNYVDALRRAGQDQKAEVVCRSFAFDEDYNRNQRYINILQAITNQRHYYHIGEDEFSVDRLSLNTDQSEYYVGLYEDKPYYITSRSYMKDPNKIFYHQNEYAIFSDSLKNRLTFPFIPADLQDGPITFSTDHDMIIVTVNKYNGMGRIKLFDNSIYSTKLYMSVYDAKKSRWSKFKPLFSEKNEYSYAYPVFINDNKSILFCSNRSGGYGGMDIYISHRGDDNKWSDPKNLGSYINTEANEITPSLHSDSLMFSSNGHVGYGGYDMYRVVFNAGVPQEGTLYHYSYPINTSYNDFGLYAHAEDAYLISDRNTQVPSDDIYHVRELATSMSSVDLSAAKLDQNHYDSGFETTITGYDNNYPILKQEFKGDSEMYAVHHEGEILLSLFFDFDSFELTADMQQQIDSVMNSSRGNTIEELHIVGYADELGQNFYNEKLSLKRATSVSALLEGYEEIRKISCEGRGKLHLNVNDTCFLPQSGEYNAGEILHRKIELYQKARRVDIIVSKIKQN